MNKQQIELKTKTYIELLSLREKFESFLDQQHTINFPRLVDYLGLIRVEIASRIGNKLS